MITTGSPDLSVIQTRGGKLFRWSSVEPVSLLQAIRSPRSFPKKYGAAGLLVTQIRILACRKIGSEMYNKRARMTLPVSPTAAKTPDEVSRWNPGVDYPAARRGAARRACRPDAPTCTRGNLSRGASGSSNDGWVGVRRVSRIPCGRILPRDTFLRMDLSELISEQSLLFVEGRIVFRLAEFPRHPLSFEYFSFLSRCSSHFCHWTCYTHA